MLERNQDPGRSLSIEKYPSKGFKIQDFEHVGNISLGKLIIY